MSIYCEVLFPLPVFQTFLYRLPPELAGKVRVGSRVIAPLGLRRLSGYVLEIKELTREPEFKVKDVIACPEDSYRLPEAILKFALELSEWSLTAPGLFLEMVEPPAFREKPRVRLVITEKGLKELVSGRLKGRRGQILSLLADRQLSPVYVRRKLKLQEINSYLRSLSQEGLLEIREKVARKKASRPVAADNFRQLMLPVRPEGLPGAGQALVEKLEAGQGGIFLLTGNLRRRQEFLKKSLIIQPDITALPFFWCRTSRGWKSGGLFKKNSAAWLRPGTASFRIKSGTTSGIRCSPAGRGLSLEPGRPFSCR